MKQESIAGCEQLEKTPGNWPLMRAYLKEKGRYWYKDKLQDGRSSIKPIGCTSEELQYLESIADEVKILPWDGTVRFVVHP